MTLANAKARAHETFIVQASLMIVAYDCQNTFIVLATGGTMVEHSTHNPLIEGSYPATGSRREQMAKIV